MARAGAKKGPLSQVGQEAVTNVKSKGKPHRVPARTTNRWAIALLRAASTFLCDFPGIGVFVSFIVLGRDGDCHAHYASHAHDCQAESGREFSRRQMSEFEKLVVAANGGKVDGAQSRLAEKLGIAQPTVSRWCKMKAVPKPDQQQSLADALGIPLEQLMALFPGAAGQSFVADSASYNVEARLRALEAAVATLQEQLRGGAWPKLPARQEIKEGEKRRPAPRPAPRSRSGR